MTAQFKGGPLTNTKILFTFNFKGYVLFPSAAEPLLFISCRTGQTSVTCMSVSCLKPFKRRYEENRKVSMKEMLQAFAVSAGKNIFTMHE